MALSSFSTIYNAGWATSNVSFAASSGSNYWVGVAVGEQLSDDEIRQARSLLNFLDSDDAQLAELASSLAEAAGVTPEAALPMLKLMRELTRLSSLAEKLQR